MELALTLMAIGMFTVFVILGIVVTSGNLVIRWVNRYHPERPITTLRTGDNKKIAAIIAAVNIVTGGRGKVESIKSKDYGTRN